PYTVYSIQIQIQAPMMARICNPCPPQFTPLKHYTLYNLQYTDFAMVLFLLIKSSAKSYVVGENSVVVTFNRRLTKEYYGANTFGFKVKIETLILPFSQVSYFSTYNIPGSIGPTIGSEDHCIFIFTIITCN